MVARLKNKTKEMPYGRVHLLQFDTLLNGADHAVVRLGDPIWDGVRRDLAFPGPGRL